MSVLQCAHSSAVPHTQRGHPRPTWLSLKDLGQVKHFLLCHTVVAVGCGHRVPDGIHPRKARSGHIVSCKRADTGAGYVHVLAALLARQSVGRRLSNACIASAWPLARFTPSSNTFSLNLVTVKHACLLHGQHGGSGAGARSAQRSPAQSARR